MTMLRFPSGQLPRPYSKYKLDHCHSVTRVHKSSMRGVEDSLEGTYRARRADAGRCFWVWCKAQLQPWVPLDPHSTYTNTAAAWEEVTHPRLQLRRVSSRGQQRSVLLLIAIYNQRTSCFTHCVIYLGHFQCFQHLFISRFYVVHTFNHVCTTEKWQY